jgi:cobalt/nickel transport system ATP-binding protein
VFGNSEILVQANLKRPMMLDVYEMLVEKNILPDERAYPRKPQDLKSVFENIT